MNKPVLVVGCGFVGEAVASILHQGGWAVTGICATLEGFEKLQFRPYTVRRCDISQFSEVRKLHDIPPPEVIFFCASTRGGTEGEYRKLYLYGICHLLEKWPSARIIFTSSTSVYAQTNGEVVDENSATEPAWTRGKILLEAEKKVLSSGGTVARFSGIYGPGRSVLMKRFLENEAVLENGGHRWINQIHRDDGALALCSLIDAQPGIYNVSDGQPASQREIYQWLADFFGRPLPPEGISRSERKRGWTNKRVCNKKLLSCQWIPAWGSYKEAIKNIAETMQ